MAKAVVVGGGIVGSAIALNLSLQSHQVILVDTPPRQNQRVSWGNAGHIAVEQVAPIASLATVRDAPRRLISPHGALSFPLHAIGTWLPFSLRLLRSSMPNRFARGKDALSTFLGGAVSAWERFTESLGQPNLLCQNGHFIVWNSDRSAEAGRKHWLTADTGTASFRDANKVEIAELQALTHQKIAGAIRCLGSGQISDPDALFRTLTEQFQARGITLLSEQARALQTDDGKATLLLESGQKLDSDILVIAAGVGAKPLLETAGYRVPMIAERGYHVQYGPASWPRSMPPVVFEDYATIITRFNSMVRAASFVEFTTPDSPADSSKWRRIDKTVHELGLPVGPRCSQWLGSRPTLPDYLPAVGKSRRFENLYYAFGHNHLGLTLGPVTAEAIGALVNGHVPAALAAFDLERFS